MLFPQDDSGNWHGKEFQKKKLEKQGWILESLSPMREQKLPIGHE